MFTYQLLAGSARGYLDAVPRQALFDGPHSVMPVNATQLLISDSRNSALRLLDLQSEQVTTVDLDAGGLALQRPRAMIVNMAQNDQILVVDFALNAVYQLHEQAIKHFAGTGERGCQDDIRQRARFDRPSAIVQARDGTIYIADTGNHSIRACRAGKIAQFSGAANKHGKADRIDELSDAPALFNAPTGLLLLRDGNMLVCDSGNGEIRHIHVGAGIVTTVVGSAKSNARNTVWHQNCAYELNAEYRCSAIDEKYKRHVNVTLEQRNLQIFSQLDSLHCPEAICQIQTGGYLIGCADGQVWYLDEKMSALRLLQEIVGLGRVTCICQHDERQYLCDYDNSRIYQLELKSAPRGIRSFAALNSALLQEQLQSSTALDPKAEYRRIGREKAAKSAPAGVPQAIESYGIGQRISAAEAPYKRRENGYPVDFGQFATLMRLMREETGRRTFCGRDRGLTGGEGRNSYLFDIKTQDPYLPGASTTYRPAFPRFPAPSAHALLHEAQEPAAVADVDEMSKLVSISLFIATVRPPEGDKYYEEMRAQFTSAVIGFDEFIFANQLIDTTLSGLLTALAIAAGQEGFSFAARLYDINGIGIFNYSQKHRIFYAQISEVVNLSTTLYLAVDYGVRVVEIQVSDAAGELVRSVSSQEFLPAQSSGLWRGDVKIAVAELELPLMLHNSSLVQPVEMDCAERFQEITDCAPLLYKVECFVTVRSTEDGVARWAEKTRKRLALRFLLSEHCNVLAQECRHVDAGIVSKVQLGVL